MMDRSDVKTAAKGSVLYDCQLDDLLMEVEITSFDCTATPKPILSPGKRRKRAKTYKGNKSKEERDRRVEMIFDTDSDDDERELRISGVLKRQIRDLL